MSPEAVDPLMPWLPPSLEAIVEESVVLVLAIEFAPQVPVTSTFWPTNALKSCEPLSITPLGCFLSTRAKPLPMDCTQPFSFSVFILWSEVLLLAVMLPWLDASVDGLGVVAVEVAP